MGLLLLPTTVTFPAPGPAPRATFALVVLESNITENVLALPTFSPQSSH
jgi:hypothetical protein